MAAAASFCFGTFCATAANADTSNSPNWLLWGGPNGNFQARAFNLADKWIGNGPPTIWRRSLGDGYSGIAVEDQVLFTAYRDEAHDVVIAVEVESGRTIWETRYAAPFKNKYSEAVGPGPYAMPQVIGNAVVMASGNGTLRSFNKQTGTLLWSHDLYARFNGTRMQFGYSNHPLPYKDKLIVLVGGKGGTLTRFTGAGASAVVALKQSNGAVVWQNLTFENAHSSPVIINVDGQEQIVALVAQEVIGFDPADGRLLWRHPHRTGNGLAASQPVWGADNILVVSSAYGGGTRALHLRQKDGKTDVRELWHNRRIQCLNGSIVRINEHAYLSSGQNSPAFLVAFNVKTGEIAWQERGFGKAQLLHADEKLIILDEDGTLAIARANPNRFELLARASLLNKFAWTPPTLVERHLYLRDREVLTKLDIATQ